MANNGLKPIRFILLWIIVFCQLFCVSQSQAIEFSPSYATENEPLNDNSHIKTGPQSEISFVQNDSYISRAPIKIQEDGDFESLGFPGNGTVEDPYRIENFNVTTDTGHGIYVKDTSMFFVIQHCFINANDTGIGIISADAFTGRIYNNICINSTYGILIQNHFVSKECRQIVDNNTCYDNKYGIVIDECQRSIIRNNFCYYNYEYGIYIKSDSNLVIVENNTVCYSRRGIYARDSMECYLTVNSLSGNWEGGICLCESQNSTISNNVFINDSLIILPSIDLWGAVNYTIENNLVNGKPIGYFVNLNGSTISEDYGQILMINCTRVNITKQYISNTLYGIFLLLCTKIQIKTSYFEHIFGLGIRTEFSSELLIFNNTFSKNHRAIETTSSTFWIVYNTFENNSDYAIKVGNGGSIHHNNFFYNNLNGRSQAYGGSSYARWYDPPKLEGNYWSDWNGEVKYDVAGSTTDDLFPLSKPVEQIPASFPIPWNIEEPTDTSFLFLYSVLLIFCLAYLSLTCNKKGKKEK